MPFLLGFQKEKPLEAEVQVAKNVPAGEAEVQVYVGVGAGAEIKRGIYGRVKTGMLIGRNVHIGLEVEVEVETEINIAKEKGKKRSRVQRGQGVWKKLGKIELLL